MIAEGSLIYVSGYDQGATFFDPNGLPFLNTLLNMENSFGYWVKINGTSSMINPDSHSDHEFIGSNKYEFFNGRIDIEGVNGSVEILREDGSVCGEMKILDGGYLMTTPVYATNAIDQIGVRESEKLLFRYKGEILSPEVEFRGNMELRKLNLFRVTEAPQLYCYPESKQWKIHS
ncbi:MAG: hypothetical protein R2771_14265 [Saprospiraceae bacterium]